MKNLRFVKDTPRKTMTYKEMKRDLERELSTSSQSYNNAQQVEQRYKYNHESVPTDNRSSSSFLLKRISHHTEAGDYGEMQLPFERDPRREKNTPQATEGYELRLQNLNLHKRENIFDQLRKKRTNGAYQKSIKRLLKETDNPVSSNNSFVRSSMVSNKKGLLRKKQNYGQKNNVRLPVLTKNESIEEFDFEANDLIDGDFGQNELAPIPPVHISASISSRSRGTRGIRGEQSRSKGFRISKKEHSNLTLNSNVLSTSHPKEKSISSKSRNISIKPLLRKNTSRSIISNNDSIENDINKTFSSHPKKQANASISQKQPPFSSSRIDELDNQSSTVRTNDIAGGGWSSSNTRSIKSSVSKEKHFKQVITADALVNEEGYHDARRSNVVKQAQNQISRRKSIEPAKCDHFNNICRIKEILLFQTSPQENILYLYSRPLLVQKATMKSTKKFGQVNQKHALISKYDDPPVYLKKRIERVSEREIQEADPSLKAPILVNITVKKSNELDIYSLQKNENKVIDNNLKVAQPKTQVNNSNDKDEANFFLSFGKANVGEAPKVDDLITNFNKSQVMKKEEKKTQPIPSLFPGSKVMQEPNDIFGRLGNKIDSSEIKSSDVIGPQENKSKKDIINYGDSLVDQGSQNSDLKDSHSPYFNTNSSQMNEHQPSKKPIEVNYPQQNNILQNIPSIEDTLTNPPTKETRIEIIDYSSSNRVIRLSIGSLPNTVIAPSKKDVEIDRKLDLSEITGTDNPLQKNASVVINPGTSLPDNRMQNMPSAKLTNGEAIMKKELPNPSIVSVAKTVDLAVNKTSIVQKPSNVLNGYTTKSDLGNEGEKNDHSVDYSNNNNRIQLRHSQGQNVLEKSIVNDESIYIEESEEEQKKEESEYSSDSVSYYQEKDEKIEDGKASIKQKSEKDFSGKLDTHIQLKFAPLPNILLLDSNNKHDGNKNSTLMSGENKDYSGDNRPIRLVIGPLPNTLGKSLKVVSDTTRSLKTPHVDSDYSASNRQIKLENAHLPNSLLLIDESQMKLVKDTPSQIQSNDYSGNNQSIRLILSSLPNTLNINFDIGESSNERSIVRVSNNDYSRNNLQIRLRDSVLPNTLIKNREELLLPSTKPIISAFLNNDYSTTNQPINLSPSRLPNTLFASGYPGPSVSASSSFLRDYSESSGKIVLSISSTCSVLTPPAPLPQALRVQAFAGGVIFNEDLVPEEEARNEPRVTSKKPMQNAPQIAKTTPKPHAAERRNLRFRKAVYAVMVYAMYEKYVADSLLQKKVSYRKYYEENLENVFDAAMQATSVMSKEFLDDLFEEEQYLDFTDTSNHVPEQKLENWDCIADICLDFLSSVLEYTLQDSDNEMFIAFLSYSCFDRSCYPDNFAFQFELDRMKFSKYNSMIGVTEIVSKFLIGTNFILRVLIIRLLLSYGEKNINSLTQQNITLVASVIYNIFIAESRKKVPRINKLPQAQVSKIQPIKRGYFKYSSGVKNSKASLFDEPIKGLIPIENMSILLEQVDDYEMIEDYLDRIVENLYLRAYAEYDKRIKLKVIGKIVYRRKVRSAISNSNVKYAGKLNTWETLMMEKHQITKKMIQDVVENQQS